MFIKYVVGKEMDRTYYRMDCFFKSEKHLSNNNNVTLTI